MFVQVQTYMPGFHNKILLLYLKDTQSRYVVELSNFCYLIREQNIFVFIRMKFKFKIFVTNDQKNSVKCRIWCQFFF